MGIKVILPIIPSFDRHENEMMVLEIGDAILNSARMSFVNSSSPHGDARSPLAASTVRSRRNGSDSPLRDTGGLMNSLMTSDVYEHGDGYAIDVGSNLIYADIHNFGGMAGRNRAVNIPQRQFLPDLHNLPSDLEDEIMDIMVNILTAALND